MILERFHVNHFEAIELQPAQAHMREFLTPAFLAKLASSDPAYTVSHDGSPLVCFGFYRWNAQAGIVWAYPACGLGRRMITVHRYAARAIGTLQGQVYAAIEQGFACGQRWIELLGFDRIGHVDSYGLAGRPHDIYLRVR